MKKKPYGKRSNISIRSVNRAPENHSIDSHIFAHVLRIKLWVWRKHKQITLKTVAMGRIFLVTKAKEIPRSVRIIVGISAVGNVCHFQANSMQQYSEIFRRDKQTHPRHSLVSLTEWLLCLK